MYNPTEKWMCAGLLPLVPNGDNRSSVTACAQSGFGMVHTLRIRNIYEGFKMKQGKVASPYKEGLLSGDVMASCAKRVLEMILWVE